MFEEWYGQLLMTREETEAQRRKFREFLKKEILEKYPRKELLYKLDITESALNMWLSNKVKVVNIPLSSWLRISSLSGYSLDELFNKLDLSPNQEEYLSLRTNYQQQRFKQLIKDLLVGGTQSSLARILETNTGTVSKWVGPGVQPINIAGSTFVILAAIKGWSVEDLIAWLGIKPEKVPLGSLAQTQEVILSLSKSEQVELLGWLANLVAKEARQGQQQQ